MTGCKKSVYIRNRMTKNCILIRHGGAKKEGGRGKVQTANWLL
jgi:hypothetical protein